jgi:hypothetical protein
MPHVITIADQQHVVRDTVEIGRAGGALLLQAFRLEDGDAVLIAGSDATRDGMPMLGRLAVVSWGAGAVIRVGGVRVEMRWQPGCAPARARADEACAVCFGTFARGETVVACDCTHAFHDDCNRARVNCMRCGTPATEVMS